MNTHERPAWFTPEDHQRADRFHALREQNRSKKISDIESSARSFAGIILQQGKSISFGTEGYRVTNEEARQEYMKTGGWKLHLTVRPENFKVVDEWLFTHHRGQYKLLSGGEEGKEFTVYVGSKDRAMSLSMEIERQIGEFLEENAAGSGDAMLTRKVAGRFDFQWLAKAQETGLKYNGHDGVPFDSAAMRATDRFVGKGDTPEFRRVAESQKKRIEEILLREFGDYYVGKKSS